MFSLFQAVILLRNMDWAKTVDIMHNFLYTYRINAAWLLCEIWLQLKSNYRLLSFKKHALFLLITILFIETSILRKLFYTENIARVSWAVLIS